jgi:Rrf2 family protein
MAAGKGEPVTSEFLAESVNTNPVVLRRILSALGKAGLVTGRRGAGGGSVLARDPSRISLLEIYRAVDDDEGPALHHRPPNANCPIGANIVPVLTKVINRAEASMERELATTSVADVVAETFASVPA